MFFIWRPRNGVCVLIWSSYADGIQWISLTSLQPKYIPTPTISEYLRIGLRTLLVWCFAGAMYSGFLVDLIDIWNEWWFECEGKAISKTLSQIELTVWMCFFNGTRSFWMSVTKPSISSTVPLCTFFSAPILFKYSRAHSIMTKCFK